MKEWKNKEVIIGLIVIIILGSIALFLLIKRELNYMRPKDNTVQEAVSEEWEESSVMEESMEEEQNQQETQSQQEIMSESSEQASSEVQTEVQSSQSQTTVGIQTLDKETSKELAEKEKQEAELYNILGKEYYTSSVLVERKEDDDQLAELFGYWDAYKLEAVDDLVHLERIQAISDELTGTNKYYYYGSVDSLGRPSGKGLAVYADNTYYCGEWKNGLRHGSGMWMQVAIYDETNKNQNLGIVEHMYNGQWSKDLPNGQGQEHFSYDYTVLNQKEECIANVIGNFKDGYYDGKMYIMTVNNQGATTDWEGTCKKGVWQPLGPAGYLGKERVWECTEDNEEGEDVYYYMFPSQNSKQGIFGMKK